MEQWKDFPIIKNICHVQKHLIIFGIVLQQNYWSFCSTKLLTLVLQICCDKKTHKTLSTTFQKCNLIFCPMLVAKLQHSTSNLISVHQHQKQNTSRFASPYCNSLMYLLAPIWWETSPFLVLLHASSSDSVCLWVSVYDSMCWVIAEIRELPSFSRDMWERYRETVMKQKGQPEKAPVFAWQYW